VSFARGDTQYDNGENAVSVFREKAFIKTKVVEARLQPLFFLHVCRKANASFITRKARIIFAVRQIHHKRKVGQAPLFFLCFN
jgi:hypothetical protein